jgi:hypothetical protein
MTIDRAEKLSRLIAQIETISPQLADYWQATAIVESLGYTDNIIQQEFDLNDALALGKYIYDRHQSLLVDRPISTRTKFNFREEFYIFLSQFCRSFVYAIPLIVILFLGNGQLSSHTKILPPQLASLFTIATLASLITSGGFVQMISRRGSFYLGLDEPLQAQKICLSILYLGLIVSFILASIGLYFGFYRSLFADIFLVIASLYYLILSLLWMLLAIISNQIKWSISIILLGFTICFLIVNNGSKLGALESQILAMLITSILVACSLVFIFRKNRNNNNKSIADVEPPRLSATVYLLAPYFNYGITYFSFIFADRLVAGWAISPNSGLIFAIDSVYQKNMDLALLNFLIVVPLIEYLSYKFIIYWFSEAKKISLNNIKQLVCKLSDRYIASILVIIIFFILLAILTRGIFKPLQQESINNLQVFIGCLGYLLFTIGLFNAIVLFSLDRISIVLRSLIPALIINLIIGYLLANLIDVSCAAFGLLLGAGWFAIRSTQQLLKAIAQFDYFYYLVGY